MQPMGTVGKGITESFQVIIATIYRAHYMSNQRDSDLMMIIIGLTGRKAAGKTTAGEIIGTKGFSYL